MRLHGVETSWQSLLSRAASFLPCTRTGLELRATPRTFHGWCRAGTQPMGHAGRGENPCRLHWNSCGRPAGGRRLSALKSPRWKEEGDAPGVDSLTPHLTKPPPYPPRRVPKTSFVARVSSCSCGATPPSGSASTRHNRILCPPHEAKFRLPPPSPSSRFMVVVARCSATRRGAWPQRQPGLPSACSADAGPFWLSSPGGASSVAAA